MPPKKRRVGVLASLLGALNGAALRTDALRSGATVAPARPQNELHEPGHQPERTTTMTQTPNADDLQGIWSENVTVGKAETASRCGYLYRSDERLCLSGEESRWASAQLGRPPNNDPRSPPIGIELASNEVYVHAGFGSTWWGRVDFAQYPGIYTRQASGCTVLVVAYLDEQGTAFERASLVHILGGNPNHGPSLPYGAVSWDQVFARMVEGTRIRAVLAVNLGRKTGEEGKPSSHRHQPADLTLDVPYAAVVNIARRYGVLPENILIYQTFEHSTKYHMSFGILKNGYFGEIKNLPDLPDEFFVPVTDESLHAEAENTLL